MPLSSLTKKYLMALSGLILVGFVLIHMLGNLQFFLGPQALNTYAYKLHTLPPIVLWGFRAFLLLSVAIHVWMAVLLTRENHAARPKRYAVASRVQSSYAARTMPMTGFILLSFIIFHILQFTVRVVPENYEETLPPATVHYQDTTIETFDVYAMMVAGFSNKWISLFYLLSMGLLCLHLSHGVSSLFQSLGLRNERWRRILDNTANVYGWFIFLGFAAVPFSVLTGLLP